MLPLLVAVSSSAGAGERIAATPAPAQWGGFYIGGHLGYGSARVSADYAVLGVPFLSGSETLNGTVYGAQFGYNIQLGQVVLGVETDISGTTQKATTSRLCSLTESSDDSVPWLGSTRLRAGYAFGPMLVYGTGGVGYGSFKSPQTFTTAVASFTTTTSTEKAA